MLVGLDITASPRRSAGRRPCPARSLGQRPWRRHDADLLFGWMLLPRQTPYVLHDGLCRRLRWSGFLSHLHSL